MPAIQELPARPSLDSLRKQARRRKQVIRALHNRLPLLQRGLIPLLPRASRGSPLRLRAILQRNPSDLQRTIGRPMT